MPASPNSLGRKDPSPFFKDHKMLNWLDASSNNKVMVKSLLDTGSLSSSTHRNKLVIYDDDPKKDAAIEEAKRRHEIYLKAQQERMDNELRIMQERSDQQKRVLDRKQLVREKEQDSVKMYLKTQMELKVSLMSLLIHV